MQDTAKQRLEKAKTPEEARRIANEYGLDIEMRKNINMELDEDSLENVSGGATYTNETRTSYSVVVRDKNTGEILCVLPY